MHIRHLSLTNFRNYRRLELALPSQTILLIGANGQGKTNLLEAIYYLTAAESPHGTDRQLLNWLAARTEPQPFLKILAEVQTARDIRQVEIRLEVQEIGLNRDQRLKKTVLIDGAKKKVGELSGLVNAVLFLPQDLNLVEGSPLDRRRYLDSTLRQVDGQYAQALVDYQQVLTNRNALLKTLQENRRSDTSQLVFWDEQLCRLGALLITKRARALEELEQLASTIHTSLTPQHDYLRLAYHPAYDPLPNIPDQLDFGLDVATQRTHLTAKHIATGMSTRLQQLRSEEIQRGVTLIGPHRDEFRFLSASIDLGIYGSRGQCRTAVLALKLAELRWLQQRTGEVPILLLDEVLAELDPQRRYDLLARLNQLEQALLTTTDRSLFDSTFQLQAQIWQVQQGVLGACM